MSKIDLPAKKDSTARWRDENFRKKDGFNGNYIK